MVSEVYIDNHIEQAISGGRIEVWFQPVIRSLSGELSGFEALARWRDERNGMISPGVFIPALEKAKKIHLLDTYVIRSICALLHDELEAGRPIVPVSFNLSQLDFELCDIIGTLEEASEEFSIPRSCLRVEITESMMTDDAGAMHRRLDRLRSGGFEVWMDDFGSGYSTLNVLKDFDFDLLKLDMKFLSDFTPKSRSILSYLIRMSKEIRVHTLAEGVETQQQYAFLRQAGCESIQGYLFGKPLPYPEAVRNIEQQNIRWETRPDIYFWNQVGRIDLQTELPVAVLEDDGTRLKPIFVTQRNHREVQSLGIMGAEAEYSFFNSDAPNHAAVQMSTFLRLLPDDGKIYSLFVQDGENYIQLTAKLFVKSRGRRVYWVCLSNISGSEKKRSLDSMERLLRNTYQLFSYIMLIQPKANRARILFGCTLSGYSDSSPEVKHSVTGMRQWIADTQVYPEDRDRFLRYFDPDRMDSMLSASEDNICEDYFRMISGDGHYSWVKSITIHAFSSGGDDYLIFNRLMPAGKLAASHALFSSMELGAQASVPSFPPEKSTAPGGKDSISGKAIWRSLLQGGSINFFWKDDQRRFLGASRSFLEYYGIQDVSEILGKTDEDMKWHVDNKPYHEDELAVLREGRYVVNSPGTCIIRGQLHHIMATKLPIYEHGRIAGLVGYFIDAEEVQSEAEKKFRTQRMDPVTGLLNSYGMLITVRYYVDSYEKNGTDFVMIRFHLHGYRQLLHEHGQDGLDTVLREVGRRLDAQAGNEAVIAYYGAGDVLALMQAEEDALVTSYAEHIRKLIENVRSVGDVTATFYVNYRYVWYHDAGSFISFHAMVDNMQLE